MTGSCSHTANFTLHSELNFLKIIDLKMKRDYFAIEILYNHNVCYVLLFYVLVSLNLYPIFGLAFQKS